MYKFRSDEGDEILLPFEEMMLQKDGIIDHGGKLYRRVHDRPKKQPATTGSAGEKPSRKIVSDALGFGEHQFVDMEADRSRNGFHGVEFIRDKDVPQFFQVQCDSPKTWEKYVQHRGMKDLNSRNGGKVYLSDEDFERAKEIVSRQFDKVQ